jgi:hypothetical protein
MTQLVVAFRKFAKAPKKGSKRRVIVIQFMMVNHPLRTDIVQDENMGIIFVPSICLNNVLTTAGILRFAQFSSLKVQENRERWTTITKYVYFKKRNLGCNLD